MVQNQWARKGDVLALPPAARIGACRPEADMAALHGACGGVRPADCVALALEPEAYPVHRQRLGSGERHCAYCASGI